jgi:hypothetical protein
MVPGDREPGRRGEQRTFMPAEVEAGSHETRNKAYLFHGFVVSCSILSSV